MVHNLLQRIIGILIPFAFVGCASVRQMVCERDLLLFPHYDSGTLVARIEHQTVHFKSNADGLLKRPCCDEIFDKPNSFARTKCKRMPYKIGFFKIACEDTNIITIDSMSEFQKGYAYEIRYQVKTDGTTRLIAQSDALNVNLSRVVIVKNGKLEVTTLTR